MSMAAGGTGDYKSDINITPLVDVVLVLLIIFMVITPLLQMGYDVKVPPKAPPTTVVDVPADQLVVIAHAQQQDLSQQTGADGSAAHDTARATI